MGPNEPFLDDFPIKTWLNYHQWISFHGKIFRKPLYLIGKNHGFLSSCPVKTNPLIPLWVSILFPGHRMVLLHLTDHFAPIHQDWLLMRPRVGSLAPWEFLWFLRGSSNYQLFGSWFTMVYADLCSIMIFTGMSES